jgi:hypothetical protein
MEISVVKIIENAALVEATASVDGKVAASAKLLYAIKVLDKNINNVWYQSIII